MWVKRILIILPLAVIVVLLQAFFWVPTYDKQGLGNPQRLLTFIQSSSGDAQILNPILAADTSSGTINNLVFEGLLDLDDKLQYRPRLATDWSMYEEAFLAIDPDWSLPGHPAPTQEDWIAFVRRALATRPGSLENVRDVEFLPPITESGSRQVVFKNQEGRPVLKNGRPQFVEVAYRVQRPARIKFILKNIDQHFFDPVESLLGAKYVARFPYAKWVHAKEPGQAYLLEDHLPEIMPVMEHNPIIVFNLRRGVTFHDGHEFDAGDVLFTYQAIMNPQNASPRTSDYEPVKRVEVLSRHKVKIVYKRLFSPAINAWMMGILPEHLLNRDALRREARSKGMLPEQADAFTLRDSDFNRNPIGTGPFIFREWQGDVQIRLKRNERYWEGPPEYHEYVMRIIPDILTQEMEFYSGATDTYGALPHQVARLKQDERFQHFSTVGFSYSYIGYNLRNPLFASREVRTALGMAIDVDQIIKYVLYGEGERVTGPFAKITDWYDHSVKPLPYDPKGALKILNDLGWKKNAEGLLEKDGKVFEFNLITNSGNPIRKNIMTIVQNNWGKLGIKCNTQLFEWAVFLQDFVNPGKFDALILGWVTGIDPDQYQIWHSSQAGPGQLNFVGYQNPEADRLIVAIRQEYNRARQIEMTHALHRIIARDQPYTFLFVQKATQLLDKKIVIVERQPDGSEKYVKIYPTKGGNIRYYFNKWRKLDHVPQFASQ